jgi:hypothetical protein
VKAAWLALAVPLAGLAELGGHFYFSRRAATPDEWAAARPAVQAAYRSGDVVVVAPYWAEPVARWKLGDELMPLREVARPDTSRYPRAIELSTMGARSPELAGWPVEQESRAGRIVVRALRNPVPPAITFDFTDHVKPPFAEAEVARNGAATPCPWTDNAPQESGGLFGAATFPSQRFRCADGSFFFVGVTVIDDERERPRRCIWSHPPSGGETVTRFRGVPLGRVIRGHTGMGWMIERDRNGAAITLRVLVDGEEVGRAVREDGDGWKAFEIPLGAHAGRTGDVEFRASAPNNVGRHLCFEADSR